MLILIQWIITIATLLHNNNNMFPSILNTWLQSLFMQRYNSIIITWEETVVYCCIYNVVHIIKHGIKYTGFYSRFKTIVI